MHPTSTSVGQLLDAAADGSPGATAIICDDGTLTFAELRDRALSFAGALANEGVMARDHVGVWMHNSIDYVTVVYAAAYLDVLLVPMNTWHKAREMAYAVLQSEITVLVVGDEIAGRDGPAAVAEALGDHDAFPQLRAIVHGSDLRSAAVLVPPSRSVIAPRDLSAPTYMLYTSGTTGKAKGVLLDDSGVTADAVLLGDRLGITAADVYFCPVPLFHAGGLIFVLLAAHAKHAAVVARSTFAADQALQDIRDLQCTIIGGFEVGFSRLLDAIDAGASAPTSLRSGWWVGTPTAMLRAEVRLALRLANLYGMTEASGNVAATPLDWDDHLRSTTQGTPLDGRVIEIVDPQTERTLGVDDVGEIRVGGWGQFHGYWRMPAESAERRDDAGRLRSGDLGSIDASGCLHFLGRADEALKVGGENVAPLEVEEVLAEHPAVDEVAVVGVPDDRYGHSLSAFVRLQPGHDSSEDELKAHVKARLASFKVPRDIQVLREDFPRTATGKVRKTELVDRVKTIHIEKQEHV